MIPWLCCDCNPFFSRDWRGNTQKFLCPSVGNGLGWLCYDHRGFLHSQPGSLPGAGQTSDKSEWYKWSQGRQDWCWQCHRVTVWLSVLVVTQPCRELHLRHREGICSWHVLQATGLITLRITNCLNCLPSRWNYPICIGRWRELTTKILNLPYKPFSMGKYCTYWCCLLP